MGFGHLSSGHEKAPGEGGLCNRCATNPTSLYNIQMHILVFGMSLASWKDSFANTDMEGDIVELGQPQRQRLRSN